MNGKTSAFPLRALLMTGAFLLATAGVRADFVTADWTITGTGSSTPLPTRQTIFGTAGSTAPTMTIRSPNNNSGNGGAYVVTWNTSPLPTFVSFNWNFIYGDSRNGNRDGAEILINGVAVDTTQPNANDSGTFSQTLNPNDILAFRVNSKDNQSGTGVAATFTISNFTGSLTAVPEASAVLTLAFTGLLVTGVVYRRRRQAAAAR